ncbi:hypothetical protein BASA81_017294 [Batrachochytrium salamandrivorans]|nr:hypothetical protein BASA81_017294 [Batrachochytrium salamandrivorans]
MSDAALKIRRNAEEYRESVTDLLAWEKQMADKDKQRQLQQYPPIRVSESGVGTISTRPTTGSTSSTAVSVLSTSKNTSSVAASSQTKKTDQRIKGSDYNAWAKFDVEKELEKVEYQSANPKPSITHYIPDGKDRIPQEDLDRIESALVEKEKGNEYFKRKNYKRAVQCYTKSIDLNPADVVPIVNRAMANIKLFNWEDATKDCTMGLEIQPKNVKALWRRGISRRELGQFQLALDDLKMAAVLEPGNSSIRQELQALEKAVDAQNTGKESLTSSKNTVTTIPSPRRRRLVIQEVGDAVQPVSTVQPNDERKNTFGSLSSHTISPAAEKSSALDKTDSQTIPLENKPTSHKVTSSNKGPSQLSTKQEETSKVPETLASSTPLMHAATALHTPSTKFKSLSISEPLKIPRSMFEYERDWKSLKNDLQCRYAYFKAISPANLPQIFKSSLETPYLCGILEVLKECYMQHETASLLLETMLSITRIERFATTAMFLSRKDKQVVSDLVAHIASCVDDMGDTSIADLARIRTAFKIK